MKPITFTKVPPLGKVTEKLGDTGKNPIIKSICDFISTRNNSSAIEAHLPNLSNVATFLRKSFEELPADKLFPLVDLFRIILSDVRVSGWFAEEKGMYIPSQSITRSNRTKFFRHSYHQNYAVLCQNPRYSILTAPSHSSSLL